MVLKTGDLRNYVTVKRGTRVSDGQGGWNTTWADAYYEWMKATPLNQSKTLDQGGIKYRKAVEFIGRVNNAYDMTGEYQIVWGSDTFTIYSAVTDETEEYVLITAYV